MNNLGPNGGYIKMPGAYHTELVEGKETIKVYLLDISFKNPVTDKSSVKIKYLGNDVKEFTCKNEQDFFECNSPKNGLKNYKEIHLYTIRYSKNNLDLQEKISIYLLPLKLKPH